MKDDRLKGRRVKSSRQGFWLTF